MDERVSYDEGGFPFIFMVYSTSARFLYLLTSPRCNFYKKGYIIQIKKPFQWDQTSGDEVCLELDHLLPPDHIRSFIIHGLSSIHLPVFFFVRVNIHVGILIYHSKEPLYLLIILKYLPLLYTIRDSRPVHEFYIVSQVIQSRGPEVYNRLGQIVSSMVYLSGNNSYVDSVKEVIEHIPYFMFVLPQPRMLGLTHFFHLIHNEVRVAKYFNKC